MNRHGLTVAALLAAHEPDLKGAPVRVYFGTEYRDGVVEHVSESVDGERCYYVRLSPGWLHLARRDDFITRPRPVVFPVEPWSAGA
jgi:hypothetical protein